MPDVPLSILAATSELPWPLDSGGHLRSFHLLSRLATRCDVRLVTTGSDATAVGPLERSGVKVRIASQSAGRRPGDAARAVRAAIRSEPYVMYGRHNLPAVRRVLLEEIQALSPDVLYLDHLDSFAYAGVAPGAAVVGDLHNVYSLLAARAAEDQSAALLRAYLSREARLLATMEHEAAARADLLMTVSSQEEQYFRRAGAAHVCVVPNGVDCDRYANLPTGRAGGPPVVLFLGTMSWPPNASAARFLALSVLPAVRHRIPGARLRIVGRDPSPEVRSLAEQVGVEVTGRVDDVLPSLADAHVLAVPLEAGGGTRLKILEAFAAGLPVVSTPVGCEGIEAEPNRHLVVATRDRFAQALLELLENPSGGQRMAENARALSREVYDWNAIGATAFHAIRETLERRRGVYRRAGSSDS